MVCSCGCQFEETRPSVHSLNFRDTDIALRHRMEGAPRRVQQITVYLHKAHSFLWYIKEKYPIYLVTQNQTLPSNRPLKPKPLGVNENFI